MDIIFLAPEEKRKFRFDYLRWDEVHPNASMNFQAGVDFYLKPLGILDRYYRAISETNASPSLTSQGIHSVIPS